MALHALTSQPSPPGIPTNVLTLPQTAQLEALYTIIRDKDTSRGDFIFYTDRIIRLLVEEGLNHLPVVSRTVETPTVSRSLCMVWPVGVPRCKNQRGVGGQANHITMTGCDLWRCWFWGTYLWRFYPSSGRGMTLPLVSHEVPAHHSDPFHWD